MRQTSFRPKKILKENSFDQFKGSRSGDRTPSSRPDSALSTSTNASGVIYRRSINSARKPRPVSIAGTGMTTSCIADISVESKSWGVRDDLIQSPNLIYTLLRYKKQLMSANRRRTGHHYQGCRVHQDDRQRRHHHRQHRQQLHRCRVHRVPKLDLQMRRNETKSDRLLPARR